MKNTIYLILICLFLNTACGNSIQNKTDFSTIYTDSIDLYESNYISLSSLDTTDFSGRYKYFLIKELYNLRDSLILQNEPEYILDEINYSIQVFSVVNDIEIIFKDTLLFENTYHDVSKKEFNEDRSYLIMAYYGEGICNIINIVVLELVEDRLIGHKFISGCSKSTWEKEILQYDVSLILDFKNILKVPYINEGFYETYVVSYIDKDRIEIYLGLYLNSDLKRKRDEILMKNRL